MKMEKVRICIKLEKEGQYLEKEIHPCAIRALTDYQYQITKQQWDLLKLWNVEKYVINFFSDLEHIEDAMLGNMIGYYENGKLVWRKKVDGEFVFGKPEWKKPGRRNKK